MTYRTDDGPDYDVDSAALEIGRAFLSAQRAASSIIAKAQREAEVLATEMSRHGAQATAVDRRPAAELDTEALAARVDEIERALFRSQEKLLRIAEPPAPSTTNGRASHYRLTREAGLIADEPAAAEPPAGMKHWSEQAAPAEEAPPTEKPAASEEAALDDSQVVEAALPTEPASVPDALTIASWEPPHAATLLGETAADVETDAAVPLSWPAPAPSERVDVEPAKPEDQPEHVGRKSGPILIPGGHNDRPWMANLIAAAVALVILCIALLLVNAL